MIGIFITRDGLVCSERGDYGNRRLKVQRYVRERISVGVVGEIEEAKLVTNMREYTLRYERGDYAVYEEI